MILLILAAIWNKEYESEYIRQVTEQDKKLYHIRFLLPFGLWVYDLLSKGHSGKDEKEWAKAIYVGEDFTSKVRMQGARQMVIAWLCLFCSCIFGIAVSLVPEKAEIKTELERPTFGQTTTYTLTVDGLRDDKEETISVSVDGKEPEKQGMTEIFDEAFDLLKVEILGENESLQNVQKNLSLPSSSIYGIRAVWKSLNPDYIDDYGSIKTECIPQEGIGVQLQVRLSYSMYEQYYTLDIRLMPESKDEAYYLKLLSKTIEDENENTKQDKILKLPSVIEDKKITYKSKEANSLKSLLFLCLFIPIVMYEMRKQKLKEAYENRNKQLIEDYPNFVFELGIMLQCGLTIRIAWNRLTHEYDEQKRKCSKEKRYLMEEMIITRNQIEAGESEAAAYGEFGRRCKSHCYVRLGNYLEQNIHQGISGVERMLDIEFSQALEQKKNLALQAGERMETKMLFPMFLLLGLVMAILMIPAFMSM